MSWQESLSLGRYIHSNSDFHKLLSTYYPLQISHIVTEACGGSTGPGKCTLAIEKGSVRSNCAYAYAFRVSAAQKWSAETKPCTNVPVCCKLCPLCSQLVWKFNLPCHFDKYHPSWQTYLPHLPDFIAEILITTEEQKENGIPNDRASNWPHSHLPPTPPTDPSTTINLDRTQCTTSTKHRRQH